MICHENRGANKTIPIVERADRVNDGAIQDAGDVPSIAKTLTPTAFSEEARLFPKKDTSPSVAIIAARRAETGIPARI